jgi:hypothetical protein
LKSRIPEEPMRTLLVPICVVLAMPFCCGLAEHDLETSTKATYAIASMVPPGVEDLTPRETDPVPAVANARCVVDDGDSNPVDVTRYNLVDPTKDPILEVPRDRNHNLEEPGTNKPVGAATKPAPIQAPSAFIPSGPDHAMQCEAKLRDKCESRCASKQLTWAPNAGEGGTCVNPSPEGSLEDVPCGCMCIKDPILPIPHP